METPDPKSLAASFQNYFSAPIERLEEACAYFLVLFRRELEGSSEFSDAVTHRLVRRTAGSC